MSYGQAMVLYFYDQHIQKTESLLRQNVERQRQRGKSIDALGSSHDLSDGMGCVCVHSLKLVELEQDDVKGTVLTYIACV